MTQPVRFPFKKPEPTPPGLESRAGELRACLQGIAAESLAAHTGAVYLPGHSGQGEFHFNLFTQPIIGVFPSLTFFTPTGEQLPPFLQAFLLYYFNTARHNADQAANAAPPTGQWVSFADLPDGRIYNQAFQELWGLDTPFLEARPGNAEFFERLRGEGRLPEQAKDVFKQGRAQAKDAAERVRSAVSKAVPEATKPQSAAA